MNLLVDTDAFCKLGVAGLLEDSTGVFGTRLTDCGRLPALPYMLRKGRLANRYGRDACNSLVSYAEAMPVHAKPGVATLAPLAFNDAITRARLSCSQQQRSSTSGSSRETNGQFEP